MKTSKLLFIAASAAILFFAGCKKDSSDARDKFVGSWAGPETDMSGGQTTTSNISLTISKSTTNSNQILVSGNNGISTPCNVSGNSLSLSNYSFTTNGDNTVESFTGTLNGGTLTINGNNTTTSGGSTYHDTFSITMTKQ